jgi:hypothetical protein
MVGHPHRVVIVDGFLGEISLKEPDTPALQQIDGRNN